MKLIQLVELQSMQSSFLSFVLLFLLIFTFKFGFFRFLVKFLIESYLENEYLYYLILVKFIPCNFVDLVL